METLGETAFTYTVPDVGNFPELFLRSVILPIDPAGVMDTYTDAINQGDADAALALVAEDAVYDRPPPLGVLVGKAAIRGFVESLIARQARVELVGTRQVDGENVSWHSRVTLQDANDPKAPPIVVLNDSASVVRDGLIIQHTAKRAQ